MPENQSEPKPIIKAVLDTNILVSALITKKGNCSAVIKSAVMQKFNIYYNAEILAEYNRVLGYQRLSFTPSETKPLLGIISRFGIIIEAQKSTFKILDEDDRIFYDTAKQSSSFLVTGNLKHYPKENFIISPVEFLTKFFPEYVVEPKAKD